MGPGEQAPVGPFEGQVTDQADQADDDDAEDELIGASSGIGHMITDSQALLATDQIIFGIIVIGLIGLCSDFAFKWLNRRLFPWAQLGR